MKFLTLLLLCCVAKDINSSTTLGQFSKDAQDRINYKMALLTKRVSAASGGSKSVKLPTAPKVPTPSNPDLVINKPPEIPLAKPKCDLKGLIALLKALFGIFEGLCSGVKKDSGPIKEQCSTAKAKVTIEFNVVFKVTEEISYDFPTCSDVVNPAIKGLSSAFGKVFDAVGKASGSSGSATNGTDTSSSGSATNGTDTSSGGPGTNGKEVDMSIKNLVMALQMVFQSMNSVTGSAKPAAGSSAADAVSASEAFLSQILQMVKSLLGMVTSVSTESSLEESEITKDLSAAIDETIEKVDGGGKILGSACVEFSARLTIIFKSVSSVDLKKATEECEKTMSDIASDLDPGAIENGTATEIVSKASENVTSLFDTIGKNCVELKADVSAMGVKVDMEEVDNILCCVITLIRELFELFLTCAKKCETSNGGSATSGTGTDTQFSMEIDELICTLIEYLVELFSLFTIVIDSLSSDTSGAAKTDILFLQLIAKTIVFVCFKVIASLLIIFEKLKESPSATLTAIVKAIGKIDLENVNFETIGKNLTQLNADTSSC